MGGGKSESFANDSSRMNSELFAQAQQLFNETDPFRRGIIDLLMNALLTGGVTPTSGTEPVADPNAVTVPDDPNDYILNRGDVEKAYRARADGINKLEDIDRVIRNHSLGDSFTLSEYRAAATAEGLSTRSTSIMNGALDRIVSGQIAPLSVLNAQGQGGVGTTALSPIIAGRGSEIRRGTANTLRQAEESLTLAGLNTSPFGQRALAEILQGGDREAALAGPNLALELLTQLGPIAAFGIAPNVVSNAGTAAGAQSSLGSSQLNANAAAFAGLMQGTSGIGQGAGTALARPSTCWIAAAFFGAGSLDFHGARQWVFLFWRGEEAEQFKEFYLRHGPAVAEQIEKKTKRGLLYRALLFPHFEEFARNGRLAMAAVRAGWQMAEAA